jgi:hypothetical protein
LESELKISQYFSISSCSMRWGGMLGVLREVCEAGC